MNRPWHEETEVRDFARHQHLSDKRLQRLLDALFVLGVVAIGVVGYLKWM